MPVVIQHPARERDGIPNTSALRCHADIRSGEEANAARIPRTMGQGVPVTAARGYARTMTNKTPREEEIQKEQEAKDAEKERLEQEEERRLG